jgi:hypothetical protein
LAGLGLAVLSGCGPHEEIAAFQAPAEPRTPTPRGTPIRLIAALAPVPDHGHWVFKLSGPEKAVAEVEPKVIAFLETVHLSNELDADKAPKISWTLPAGWEEREGGGKFRAKTIDIPGSNDTLEMTVSHFDSKLRLLENINRWREQFLGRNSISAKEIPLVSRELPMHGGKATLVDMRGHDPRRPVADDFDYDKPEAWKKLPGGVAFAKVAFRVGDGEKSATVTLTQAGGSPGDNLNRWRGQLKLPVLEVDALIKTVSHLEIDGKEGLYVDYAAEAPGTPVERILGVIFELNDRQWIAKMSGPKAVLEVEKPQFERFVRSLRPARK